MKKVIEEIRQKLNEIADPEIKKGSERFFKEPIRCYGTNTAQVTKFSKEVFTSIKHLEKEEIFTLCDELWESGYLEESFIACNWSYLLKDRYEISDINRFEKWLNCYVSNWASCDTLCNHTIGTLVEMYPNLIVKLKEWAKSEIRWVKRGAAVTLIIPARRGKFLDDIFEIALLLLNDKDDLVQKGYGWMLKAASEAYQKEVFDFVMHHKSTMPRTALRYAIEKMPKDLRALAMQK